MKLQVMNEMLVITDLRCIFLLLNALLSFKWIIMKVLIMSILWDWRLKG